MYDTHCMHTFLNQLYNFHRNCFKQTVHLCVQWFPANYVFFYAILPLIFHFNSFEAHLHFILT